jgi:hypothetical protein
MCSALRSKGFREEDKGRDHIFFFLNATGQVTAIFTKVSRGSSHKVIDDSLLGKMSRQLRITNGELRRFAECTLSQVQYTDTLKKNGHLK